MDGQEGTQTYFGGPTLLAATSALVFSASVALLYVRYQSRIFKDSNSSSGCFQSASGNDENQEDAPSETAVQVTVLYGTQTGTAERFAKKLVTEAVPRYGGKARFRAVDVEEWDFKDQLPKADVLIALFATYGDGEPTDSASDFVRWLEDQEEADEEPLLGKPFGVFGLGNRQYEHFNAMGKLLDKRFTKLGGSRLVPVGLGDDDENIEDDFDRWTERLWSSLDEALGGGAGGGAAAAAAAAPAYDAEVLPAGTPEAAGAGSLGHGHAAPAMVRVAEVRELHSAESERSCVHVELELGGSGLSYTAGDHVGVHPANSEEAVEAAAGLLGVPLDSVVRLSLPEGRAADLLSAPPPTPATLRTLLTWHTDLLGPVHRPALAALAACASDAADKDRLALLSSQEGKQEFASWVSQPQRSLLCVMREFPSARPSLGLFFGAIAPRLQPRYYSISSAPAASDGRMSITCAVVDEETSAGRRHRGVASMWLARQSEGAEVPAHVRSSTFKLPRRHETPIIMIGPGTGIAPFRGFLQERATARAAGKDLGEALLFFGCRDRAKDFIYEAELRDFVRSGVLSELFTAFSREDPGKKDYVQHHLLANAERVWGLIGEGGHLYVCGDAKRMAKDVHEALVEAAQKARGLSREAAAAELHFLADCGRYLKDVW
uniref:NADPH--hemoprotein reductase n=1 Tax=Tetraselmis sp. GSL018 TaxID=582737 RepID=A0A061R8L6_9CHLO